MLLNAAKCQGCSFYHFWVIKGKPIGGGGGGIKLSPTQIRAKHVESYLLMVSKNYRNMFWWLFLTNKNSDSLDKKFYSVSKLKLLLQYASYIL